MTIDGFDKHYYDDYTVVPKHLKNRLKFSQKYNGAGQRWLLAICTTTGLIIALDGPHMPGMYNDLGIYTRFLKKNLSLVKKFWEIGSSRMMKHA